MGSNPLAMRRVARSEASARGVRAPFSVAAAADSLFRPVASSSLVALVDDRDVELDMSREARASYALDSRERRSTIRARRAAQASRTGARRRYPLPRCSRVSLLALSR